MNKTLSREEILSFFPPRPTRCNKGDFGKNVIFASCDRFVGASKIACLGSTSMRMGSGYTALAVTESVARSISPEVFECILSIQSEKDGKFLFDKKRVDEATAKAKSVAVGMGMGKSEEVRRLILYLFDTFEGNLLIDADGLNSVTASDLERRRKCSLTVTPHLVEFSRLFCVERSEIEKNGVEISKSLAEKYGIVIHLKGDRSITTDGKTVYEVVDSTPSLAKAGSGDFLSGVVSALLLRLEPLIATSVGAQLVASSAKILSEKYNDNVLLARDLPEGILEYFRH